MLKSAFYWFAVFFFFQPVAHLNLWIQTTPIPASNLPGPRSDGSILLPNLWSLRPAGKQVALGDFPVNIAVHPSGKWAAILHSGDSEHEIITVEIPAGQIVSRAPIEESFYGLTFSPDGTKIYCSGAGDELIHSFDFKSGYLGEHATIVLDDPKNRGIPAGLAMTRDGKQLFAANVWGQNLAEVTLDSGKVRHFSLSTNIIVRPNLPALAAKMKPPSPRGPKRFWRSPMPTIHSPTPALPTKSAIAFMSATGRSQSSV